VHFELRGEESGYRGEDGARIKEVEMYNGDT